MSGQLGNIKKGNEMGQNELAPDAAKSNPSVTIVEGTHKNHVSFKNLLLY